jgi:putative hemolysin
LAFKPLNKLKSGLDKFESFLKLSKHKVNSFRPKISFFVEGGPYKCRTAENVDDLIQCLKLRYSVFYGELLHRKESVHGIDVDEMDILCDHLMIVEKESGQVVGTYRLASSIYTQKFYSQGEFEIFLAKRLNLAELAFTRIIAAGW